ncbi:Protein ELYS, partial [Gryllus bimaculatus]
DALDMVLDPLVSPKDLQPWQHRFIVQALLSQGQHTKALEYFTVRQLPVQGIEDIQLKITLLVMNKQVTQAYNFLQQYHNEENNKELLVHFYRECGKAQQLGTVLKLMLSPGEEDLLMNYLQSCNISQSEDMQVVFYLMRSRVIEAVAVNERINFSGIRKIGSRRPRNETVRDMLVGGYAKTLPSVTRQLANYCSQQKKLLSNWRQVQRPSPMSVDVNYGTKQAVSYKSSLIHATLEKARETWMMPVHSPFNSEARKEIMDVSAMQNLPFLCTSHDSFRHDRETTPVVFPSVTSSIKRRIDDDGGIPASSPLKRSRLENSSPVDNFFPKTKKSVHDHSVSSSGLLKTPLVKRVTPMKQFSASSTQEINVLRPFAETFTPQSILKVRNLVRSSVSPEHSRGHEDDLLSREHSKVKHNEEKVCSRQIRFSLPVSNEVQEQPLSSSTPDISEKIKTPKRIVDATSRLPLRSSLSLLQKTVVEVSQKISCDDVSEKKSQRLGSPAKKMVSEEDVYVFGSGNSLIENSNSELDGEVMNDRVCMLNESLGEESFYSATSSDSGTSKDSSNINSCNVESSPLYNRGKYIREIKEIKPRRRLSRVKVSFQDNLSDNGKQNERMKYSPQDAEQGTKFKSNFSHKDSVSEIKMKTQRSKVDNDEDVDSSVSEDSEENSNISCVASKKSILGDTCINISSSSSSTNASASSYNIEESDYSFVNNTPEVRVETPQQSEVSSIGKIQQVKGRLPLTRVRKSSNHESSSFIFQTVKSSSLETTKIIEKDVLTDDTKIEIDLETEGKEGPVDVEDDSINISDDKSSVDSVVLDDTDVEIVEEPKGKGSSSCSSVESEALVISDSTDIKSQKTFQEELDVCFSNISRNTTQGCYQQENKCEDFVQKDQDDSGNQENKCEDVGEKDQDDSGKIYASFTTVITQQSSYQEMLPHHQDVNQGVSVLHNSSEGHGNLSTVILVEHQIDPMGVIYTRTATNVQESDETFVGMENGCTVGNQCVDFAKGIEKRRAEDNTNLMEQDFFTAGDTLATVEDKNVSEKDNLQHSIMSHESKNALKGSYNEDVSKPTKNMEYSYGGAVESDVLDSECIEEPVKGQDIGEVDQETCMLKQSSMGKKCESQRESNKNNAYSEAMDWNENADEEDIVLKLSDSENDVSQCDREGIEDQALTTEGHQVLLQTTIKTENQLEKALTSDHTTLETEMPVSLAQNVEFEGSTHVDDSHSMSNIPSTDHSVGSKIVNLTAQSQVDKYKNWDCSVESQQLQHSNEVEITSVVGVQSSMDGVALPDVTMSENQESKLNSETLEDHYSLRSHQRSRKSSVENVPSRMANMLETVHQGKEISQKYSEKMRPRTRRRSLQIESSEGEAETLENKNETVLEESYSSLTVSKSRHRRKSSSVQSEPPLMADVLEDKYQKKEISQPSDNIRSRTRRSSLPVESFGMSDKFASPRKNEVTELEEMSTPNTRRRRKLFSTILNEPTQMADVSEIEHRIKDQDTEAQQTGSGVATDFKTEAHSMDDVHASKTRRQWSKSVQSELLQVTEGSSVKDINECVQEHSEHIVKQSSLQMEPAVESKDMIEAVNEISTPRSRLRPQSSSVQREPSQTFEASVKEGETVNQRNLKDPELLKSRRLRNSAQNENSEMDSGLSENKGFEISAGNLTPVTRKSCQSNSEAEMPLGKGEQAQKPENEKSFHKEYKSLHDLSLSNTSIAENVPLVVKPTEDPQPSTSFVPVVEEIRMNLRSRRACSVDREIPNTRSKKKNVNSGNSSDSDDCSVQSEPPQLCDVTKIKQLRNSKSRRGLSKKKSRKSSYVLRIPAPKLPCVKEEPEMESCVGDDQEISQHSKSENLPTSVRNLRPRKHSESGDSQTSSLGKSRVLRNSHSDDRVDSPVSISSRSTVILDMSHKRKRSSSPSSPERLEVRKFQRVNEDIAEENDAVETTEEIREEGKAQNINPHEIEQYATARRLTRYQKNLMERSMESTKAVRREFHGSQLSSDQSGEESDGESVASGYTTGSSHVRSSARLQEKRQMMDRSPSQSSKASYSPQKRSSRHSSPAHSLEKRGGGSPASVRSGRSTSYASSASSSQWPSPDSAQIQSPLKPRRKSFQNAQHALFSPSTKKHSSLKTPVTTTDTSEAESIGEFCERNFNEKPIQKDETTSETASVKGLASATLSVSRNTRSTAKYETEQSSKIRKSKGRSSQANVHPKKGVRLFKEARLGLSSSSEDSPTKDAKSQEEAAMSAKTQETKKAVEKPARFSVFRKRKYVKIYSKQRKTP